MSLTMFNWLTIVIGVALAMSIECSIAKQVSSSNAFQTIQAESFDFVNGSSKVYSCDGTVYLGNNSLDSTVAYYSVDFGTGAAKVDFWLRTWVSDVSKGNVILHLDSPQAPVFASFGLASTGEGTCVFGINSALIYINPTGFHDLYLTFDPDNYYGLCDIDWFVFDATSGNETRFDAFSFIQAEHFDSTTMNVLEICPGSEVRYIGNLKAGAVIGYYGVDFGTGAQVIEMRVAAWDQGTIYLHLDSALDEPFAAVPVQKVGTEVDGCSFVIIDQFVSTVPTGVHDLYFTFGLPTGVEKFVNIDLYTFKKTTPITLNN